jgi:hypothetical protein
MDGVDSGSTEIDGETELKRLEEQMSALPAED